MSTDRLIELARRKERLIARAAQQRAEIAAACMNLRQPFSLVDRGIAIIGFLKSHPLVLALAAAAAAVIGRRNLPRWIRRGFFMWRTLRTAGVLMRKSPF